MTSLTHDAIRYALTYLDQNNLVDYSAFDEDNDGYIDAITFLHSGYAAEWGGTDQYQTYYTDRIWSHKWALNGNPFTSSSGVKVFEYHISPGVWGTSGSDIGRMGVIAHETGHFLGLPDLYDGSGGSGIGNFGLMANSWGFDGSQYYPPYLSAWSRLQLGWASATAPVEGANVIEAASIQDATQPQLYKIDEGFPSGEYLLIENRQAAGFDGALPQGGLAIFHIDENAPSFTTEGYPGQAGWPQNGNHYRVALLQADGNYNMEKGHNRGDGGDVYHGNGVASITPSVDVATGPFPNTDAYQSGIVQPTHVFITDISVSSNVMTFSYHTGSAIATGSPSSNPTDHPSNAPSTAPTMPTSTPSSTPTQAPSASPTMAPIMPCALANVGESCSGNEDCCSGSCSGGKPSKRVCLGLSPTEAPAGGTSPTEAPDAGGDCLATGTLCRGGGCNSCCSGATTGSGKTKTCT